MEENIKVEIDLDGFPIKEEIDEDKDDIPQFSCTDNTCTAGIEGTCTAHVQEQDVKPKLELAEIKGNFYT